MNTVKWFLRLSVVALALTFTAGTLTSCRSRGAERAGEKIDEAWEDTKDAADEAGDKIERGIERAGDKIEDATD